MLHFTFRQLDSDELDDVRDSDTKLDEESEETSEPLVANEAADC